LHVSAGCGGRQGHFRHGGFAGLAKVADGFGLEVDKRERHCARPSG